MTIQVITSVSLIYSPSIVFLCMTPQGKHGLSQKSFFVMNYTQNPQKIYDHVQHIVHHEWQYSPIKRNSQKCTHKDLYLCGHSSLDELYVHFLCTESHLAPMVHMLICRVHGFILERRWETGVKILNKSNYERRKIRGRTILRNKQRTYYKIFTHVCNRGCYQ